MKKLLLLPLVALFLGLTPAPASANHLPPFIPPGLPVFIGPLPPNINLKVDLCHNGTVVPVNINAVAGAQDTGHGLLTLDIFGKVTAFVAHTEGGGHAVDTVLRVYLKHGNQELDLDVEAGSCADPFDPKNCDDFATRAELDAYLATLTPGQLVLAKAEMDADKDGVLCEDLVDTPPATQPPVVVEKEVIKEVPVVVEKEVPGPTQVIEITRTVEVPTSPPPTMPEKAPQGELPRTGSPAILLTMLGTGLAGSGLILRRLFR